MFPATMGRTFVPKVPNVVNNNNNKAHLDVAHLLRGFAVLMEHAVLEAGSVNRVAAPDDSTTDLTLLID